MYELIAGKHPLWEKGEDKRRYRVNLLEFKKLRYGRRFTQLT